MGAPDLQRSIVGALTHVQSDATPALSQTNGLQATSQSDAPSQVYVRADVIPTVEG